VDLVVGTSMGSFIGGLYASGIGPHAIEERFLAADFDAGYRDARSRSDIPNRRQRQIDSFPIQLDLGFDGTSVKLPKGIIQGQAVKALIDEMLGPRADFQSFDALNIPFRAVATDVETGTQVILDRGDLATAMQTSMAIPVIVRPIEHQGRPLVDGGIVNNLPVSVARDLGADIIIAVNIGAPELNGDELDSSAAIANQLTSFLTGINVQRAKALLGEQDVLVEPTLDGIATLGFERVADAILEGHAEARRKLLGHVPLQAIADPRPEPRKPVQLVPDRVRVDRIELQNNSALGEDYILDRIGLVAGQWYSQSEIQQGVARLYGQGTLARITTSWRQIGALNVLHINVDEKEWGPGYLDFKLSFEDDFESFSEYQIGAAYRLTNLSRYGAEWYSSAEFGTRKFVGSELYWPLATTGLFWHLAADYAREVFDSASTGAALGNVTEVEYGALGGLGWDGIDRLSVVLGLLHREGEITIDSAFAQSLPDSRHSLRQRGLGLDLNYDSLDHASFPVSGVKFRAELARSRDSFDRATDYSTRLDTELNSVISFGAHRFRHLLRYQSILNDSEQSLLGAFSLGGFLNLSGLRRDALAGAHVRFTSLVYHYELASNNFGALKLPLYLGASLEVGNAWQRKQDIHYDDLLHSGSLFIAWDSPLGPAYLAYGRSDTDDQSFYVFLGVTF
jgi:NTE family protein